jgi:hypothetical protein
MQSLSKMRVDHQARIREWTAQGSGGFYAYARIEFRQGWRVAVEGTNYQGDIGAQALLITAYALGM